MIDALLFGQAAVKDLLAAQRRLAEAKGVKGKRSFEPPKNDQELRTKVKQLTWEKVRAGLHA